MEVDLRSGYLQVSKAFILWQDSYVTKDLPTK